MNRSFLDSFAANPKHRASVAAARLSLAFTEDLIHRMDALGMTRAQLARAIDKSPAYVSKILNGDTNFTLETMAALAEAVDGTVHARLCAADDRVMWVAHTLDHATRDDRADKGEGNETLAVAA